MNSLRCAVGLDYGLVAPGPITVKGMPQWLSGLVYCNRNLHFALLPA